MKAYNSDFLYIKAKSIHDAYSQIMLTYIKHNDYFSMPATICITDVTESGLPESIGDPYDKYYKAFNSEAIKNHWIENSDSWYVSYSRRVIQPRGDIDLWEKAKRQLMSEKETRRSVISTYRQEDDYNSFLPSLISLQFIVNNNQLDLFAYWRSKEATVAFPVNAINMCYLLKKMYSEIITFYPNLQLGFYVESDASLHKLQGRSHSNISENVRALDIERIKFYWSVVEKGKENNYDGQYK